MTPFSNVASLGPTSTDTCMSYWWY